MTFEEAFEQANAAGYRVAMCQQVFDAWVVCFTVDRDDHVWRPISGRGATAREALEKALQKVAAHMCGG